MSPSPLEVVVMLGRQFLAKLPGHRVGGQSVSRFRRMTLGRIDGQ